MDWLADNLYWVEEDIDGRGKVVVAKSDGRYKRSLITDLENPTSVAVNPQQGKMFWSNSGRNAKIETSWLNGLHRETLVGENLGHPTGLSVDVAMDGAVYWADAKFDTIESVYHDGSARRTLIKGAGVKHPVALDVFESYVFWVTRDTGEIIRQDKFGSGVPVVIARDLLNPSDVKGLFIVFFFNCSSIAWFQFITRLGTTQRPLIHASLVFVPISV